MSYSQQIEELDRLRRSVMGRLEGLESEALNRRQASGGWSPAQIVAHVISAERRSLAYLVKRTQSPDSIPKSGLISACRSALLGFVMRSSLRVKAPPGAGEVPESAELDELRLDWDQVRADWKAFIEEYPVELEGKAVYRHPIAGRLSLEQALRFLVQHLDRHCRQIDRVLSEAA